VAGSNSAADSVPNNLDEGGKRLGRDRTILRVAVVWGELTH